MTPRQTPKHPGEHPEDGAATALRDTGSAGAEGAEALTERCRDSLAQLPFLHCQLLNAALARALSTEAVQPQTGPLPEADEGEQ